jgi:NAD(P)-dependent dehydrogenase (short-subunit alcohol dehydrogenase family)
MSGALSGKVCLIAGTTGIGGAAARLFGQEGARVVAIGRSPENAAALGDELARRNIEHAVIARDLAEDAAAERVHAAAIARFGRVDVLFHVAGISGRKFGDGPLAECTDAGWDAVFTINLRALMQLNRACLRHWLAHGQRGAILNMASVLGFSFAPAHFDAVAYASTKAAIIAMSQHTAALYAARGIRVNVIAPALVETPMAARATQSPAILEFLKGKQPLTGQPLTGEDCARAAIFLCSDAAAAITGIVLPVDGGWCVSG